MVDILLTCGKHLHDHIISLTGKVLVLKTLLIQPLYIERPVQSQQSERKCCIHVLSVTILSLCLWFSDWIFEMLRRSVVYLCVFFGVGGKRGDLHLIIYILQSIICHIP